MVLDVQADLRRRLAEYLAPISVNVRVPKDRPSEFVVVTREGGSEINELLDGPGVAIWCWADTEERASQIAHSVDRFMHSLKFSDGYTTVLRESMRSSPDIFTDTPRWYISYSLITYEPIKED